MYKETALCLHGLGSKEYIKQIQGIIHFQHENCTLKWTSSTLIVLNYSYYYKLYAKYCTIDFFAYFGDCTSLHAWDCTVEITLAGDCTDEIIQG